VTDAPSPGGKRVVFVNRFAWPDHSATAQMLTDLASGLATRGWAVTVIASRLRYEGGDPLPPREGHAGVAIHRVATTRFGRGALPGRAVDYASFYLTASFAAWRLLRRGDILVAKTDPPLLQVPLALVAWGRGARQINWMQDVYPELAAALGLRLFAQWPGRLLAGLRGRSIRASAGTVAIGGRMKERLVAAGADSATVAEIHNWGDDAVLAAAAGPSPLRAAWGYADERLVVGYSGNLGRAHELDTMLDAARLLGAGEAPEVAPVDFLFIGGGALRERLAAAALPNVSVRPYQPREMLPQSMAVADLHWLSLQPALEGLIVPSKFYGAAASGRPVLFVGDPDGEVARLIRHHACGWTFCPGESAEVAELLRDLAGNRALLREHGANARRMVQDHFSRGHGIAAWDELLCAVARRPAA